MLIAMTLVFLILVSGCFFAAVVRNRCFEEVLPLSCGGIPVILFFTGLAVGLKAAFWIVLAVAGVFYCISIWFLFSRRGKGSLHAFFTPGFVIFALLFVFLLVIHYKRMANGFDEFSHWIDVVKAMTALDDFGTHPAAHILFQSYPPGMALFQFFFQKMILLVCPGNGFTEWACYPAYQLLAFCFFFPMLKKLTWKRLIPAGIVFLAVVFSVLSLYDYGLTMCYIDPYLGIAAGSGFALLYFRKEKDAVTDTAILIILFSLVMAKDSGLFFAGMLGIAAAIKTWFPLRKLKDRKNLFNALCFTLMIAVAIFLPKVLWKMHYTSRGCGKSFSSPIDWNVLLSILRGTDTGWHRNALEYYYHALLTNQQEIGSFGIRITYPVLGGLLLLGLTGLSFLNRKNEKELSLARFTVLMAFLTTVLYSVGLGVIYLFEFGESGTMNLLSFDRYLRVPFLAMLVMIFLLALRLVTAKGRFAYSAAAGVMVLFVMILPVETAKGIITRKSVAETRNFRAPYNLLSKEVFDDFEQENSLQVDDHPRVFIVSQGDGGWDYYTLRYCLRPCISEGWSLTPEGPAYEGAQILSPEKWAEELAQFDYVIVYRADYAFIETYGSLFASYMDGSPAVEERTVYRVDHGEGKMIKLGYGREDLSDSNVNYLLGNIISFEDPSRVPMQYMVSGFSQTENGFTWSLGKETEILLRTDTEPTQDLTAEWKWSMVNRKQECEIFVNGIQVYDGILDSEEEILRFRIPMEAISEDGEIRIQFHFPDACAPGNGDSRELAVAFRTLKLEPVLE